MISRKPLVSVCIPTYNGEQWIIDTLRSIQNQTYQEIELLISDNCSDDQTVEVARSFLKGSRIENWKILLNPNRGIGKNWNFCLEQCNGEYIKLLMQDDLVSVDHFSEMVTHLEKHPAAGFAFCRREFIDSKGEIIPQNQMDTDSALQMNILDLFEESNVMTRSLFKHSQFLKNPLNKIGEPSTVLLRKSAVVETGKFSEKLNQSLDYEYWYRILKNWDGLFVDKTLVKFRKHAMQASVLNEPDRHQESLHRYLNYLSEFYSHLGIRNLLKLLYRIPKYAFRNAIYKIFNV